MCPANTPGRGPEAGPAPGRVTHTHTHIDKCTHTALGSREDPMAKEHAVQQSCMLKQPYAVNNTYEVTYLRLTQRSGRRSKGVLPAHDHSHRQAFAA